MKQKTEIKKIQGLKSFFQTVQAYNGEINRHQPNVFKTDEINQYKTAIFQKPTQSI